MIRITMLALGVALAAPTAAFAASIDDRASEMATNIELGRRDGSITWREGIALRKQQAAIARAKDELASDGYLSRTDRRELRTMQNDAEDRIDQEGNDGWRRLWWLPRFGK